LPILDRSKLFCPKANEGSSMDFPDRQLA